METSSHQSFSMPGLFTQNRSDGFSTPDTEILAPTPRLFSTTAATSGRVIDSNAHETRKRYRHGDSTSYISTPQKQSTDLWTEGSASISRFSDAKSPPPLANDQYRLADGMEKPGIFAQQPSDYDDYFQLEKQRGIWTPSVQPPRPRHPLSTESAESTPNGSKPWMLNHIINLVGGVAGTLVQFCSRPFRGFQAAGGGQGYTFGDKGEIVPANAGPLPTEAAETAPVQKILPGGFPEENFGVRSIDALEDERPRMTKRLRTGENWVMVDHDGNTASRPSTPRVSERRLPTRTDSPSLIPRPVKRTSISTATPKRPSLIPVSRRSTGKPVGQSSTPRSPQPYTSSRTYNRQNYGSPVVVKDNATTRRSSLTPESHQLINRMRREELEDDARLRRMSSQMSQMLREAQEALNSRFEPDGDYT